MMNRFTSLAAVVSLSLAGAACQSTGTDWLGQNRSDEFNSQQNASYQAMPNNPSVDQQDAHVSGHDPIAGSSNSSTPGTANSSDVGNLGRPDASGIGNGSTNSVNPGSSASENR